MLLVYNKKLQLQFKILLRKRKINVDSKARIQIWTPRHNISLRLALHTYTYNIHTTLDTYT